MRTEDFKDLDILINFYSEIHKTIEGKHIDGLNGIEYTESIARKTFLHICSAYSLSKGIKIQLKNNSEIQLIDYSSIAVLIRSSIESYLTFNHIFISSNIFSFNGRNDRRRDKRCYVVKFNLSFCKLILFVLKSLALFNFDVNSSRVYPTI